MKHLRWSAEEMYWSVVCSIAGNRNRVPRFFFGIRQWEEESVYVDVYVLSNHHSTLRPYE